MTNSTDSMFETALTSATTIAHLNGRPVELVLKNGDVFEGVLTNVESIFGAPFGGVTVDPQPDDDPAKTYQWAFTIAGRKILAQEVAAFTVKRP
jgi:hypothetical protein